MSHHANRKTLLLRLAELTGRMDRIEQALESPHTRDWEDLAIERADDEVMERLGVESQQEVARIRSALQRYADGNYGICVKCGDAIAQPRLDLIPDTPFCATCAAGA